MRKVTRYLDAEQRETLLWLADLGLAVFSSGLAVTILNDAIDEFVI